MQRVVFKVLIVGTAILLLSFGGAIWAAPVTIPLLIYAICKVKLTCRWRIIAALILALTVTQCTWAIMYITVGESNPSVWIAPIAAFTISVTAITVTWVIRRGRIASRSGP